MKAPTSDKLQFGSTNKADDSLDVDAILRYGGVGIGETTQMILGTEGNDARENPYSLKKPIANPSREMLARSRGNNGKAPPLYPNGVPDLAQSNNRSRAGNSENTMDFIDNLIKEGAMSNGRANDMMR